MEFLEDDDDAMLDVSANVELFVLDANCKEKTNKDCGSTQSFQNLNLPVLSGSVSQSSPSILDYTPLKQSLDSSSTVIK